jgi:hypothetical protein
MCRMNELSRPTRYGDGDGRIEWTSLNWTIWSSESAKACATDTIVVWFRRVTCVMKQFFFAPRTVGYRNVIWQFKDACYSFRPKIVGAWLLPVLKRRKEANLEWFLISGGQFGKKGQESVWKQGKISSSTLLYCQGWYFLTSKSSKSLCPFGHLRVSPLVAAVVPCWVCFGFFRSAGLLGGLLCRCPFLVASCFRLQEGNEKGSLEFYFLLFGKIGIREFSTT